MSVRRISDTNQLSNVVHMRGHLTNWTKEDVENIAEQKANEVIDEVIDEKVETSIRTNEDVQQAIRDLFNDQSVDSMFNRELVQRGIEGYEFTAENEVLNIEQEWPVVNE